MVLDRLTLQDGTKLVRVPTAEVRKDQPRWFHTSHWTPYLMRKPGTPGSACMSRTDLHRLPPHGGIESAWVEEATALARKEVWYVAHPVSGDWRGNCERVKEWVRWLIEADPTRVYVAPWVAEVEAWGDREVPSGFYDRVLADDCEVVRRLDGLVAVGGRWSTGMMREAECARANDIPVADWTRYELPGDVPSGARPEV